MASSVHFRTSASAARQYRDAVVVWAILAGASGIGVIAAGLAYGTNRPRLDRYQHDAVCSAPLASPPDTNDSACTVETAYVARRWSRSYRSSHSYYLAVVTSDAIVDSMELKGAVRRILWDATDNGQEVLVQRFRDPTVRKVHITLVQADGVISSTAWNPITRNQNALAGIAVFSVTTVGALLVVALVRVRKRRALARYASARPGDA